MSGGNDSEEKTLPPSAKKLNESRKKGQVPKSRELVTAVLTVTAFGVLALRGPAAFDQLRAELGAVGSLATDQPFSTALGTIAWQLGIVAAGVLGPLFALLVAGVVVGNIAVNGGLVLALDPVLPKLERLDPVEGFKRLFALRSLIELVKTLVKLTLVLTTAFLLLRGALAPLVQQPSCDLACAPGLLRDLLQPLLIAACLGFLVVGTLDIGIQRWLFRRDMRMTRTEQKRERKEQEGDPLLKRHHKREQRSAAQSRMRAGLRNATFVVRSGTVCCAMRFAPPDAQVPIMVARARDEAASLLTAEARRRGVPVVYNPAVAAALDGQLKVGMMITKAMFPSVIACMREARVL